VRDACTCPRLAQHDICFALTNEYSILFCARGATLSQFHCSEVLESFFPEDLVAAFVRREQSQAFGAGAGSGADAGRASSPVVMHICESLELLAVAVQGYILVLTLDLEFIMQNLHYFNVDEVTAAAFGMSGDWDEAEMRAVWDQNPEATVFDLACSKCIKGASLIHSEDWMLFAPDPQMLSRLPALRAATGSSYSKWVYHTERCTVWCADTLEGLSCSLVCSGRGSWIEFLPLVRENRASQWERRRSNEMGFDPVESRASSSLRFTKPQTEDHESWVSAVAAGDNMNLGCTGDSSGCLVLWKSVGDEELQRARRERKENKRLEDLAKKKERRVCTCVCGCLRLCVCPMRCVLSPSLRAKWHELTSPQPFTTCCIGAGRGSNRARGTRRPAGRCHGRRQRVPRRQPGGKSRGSGSRWAEERGGGGRQS